MTSLSASRGLTINNLRAKHKDQRNTPGIESERGKDMLRESTMRMLEEYGVQLDPALDEQQIVDHEVIQALIEVAEVEAGDTVLEIGAGTGNITVELAHRAVKIIAIEKNPKFMPLLVERTANYPNVTLIQGDALTTRLPPFTKLVSNLPYSISEAVLNHLIPLKFERAAIIVPQSYAKTLMVRPSERGYTKLSIVANSFFNVQYMRDVSSDAYLPPSKTKTGIVLLEPKEARNRAEDILCRTLLQGDRKLKNALREAIIASSNVYGGPSTKRGAMTQIETIGVGRRTLEKPVARLSLKELQTVVGGLSRI